jgi:hypothetical protein
MVLRQPARRQRARSFAIVAPGKHQGENAMPRRNEDLIRKLVQIQEQARITMEELPGAQKLARDRLKLIVGLAGYLATALQLDEPLEIVSIEDEAPRKSLQ